MPPPTARQDDTETRADRSPLTERNHAGNKSRTPTTKKMRRREQKPNAHHEKSATPEADRHTLTMIEERTNTKAGPTMAMEATPSAGCKYLTGAFLSLIFSLSKLFGFSLFPSFTLAPL
ncbi:hypothetical protein Rs2_37355 [Raphanus sativus]|nr:hypothetical protein Rs2_37345 [Raphanus sativus]KAJ4880300.1 hypothetical protein Rs2_37355 [Raphanus sativus]